MSEENNNKFVGFLKGFFMVVGIIATILVVVSALAIFYIIKNKPFGIDINPFAQSQTSSGYDHPLLSPEQEKALQSLGVNLESIPTAITPAQEQCAVQVLGSDRVNQIKSGAVPSIADYLKAKDCF